QLHEAGVAVRGLRPQLALEGHVGQPQLGLTRRLEEGKLGLDVLEVLLRQLVLGAVQGLVAALEVGARLAGIVRLAEVTVVGEQSAGGGENEGGEREEAGKAHRRVEHPTLLRPSLPPQAEAPARGRGRSRGPGAGGPAVWAECPERPGETQRPERSSPPRGWPPRVPLP